MVASIHTREPRIRTSLRLLSGQPCVTACHGLVQQTHDALLLACHSALRLHRRRLRRRDTVGSRLCTVWGRRVLAELTWIAVGASLARCVGCCGSRAGRCTHAACTAVALAARVAGTTGAVCTMVLHFAKLTATQLACRLAGKRHSGVGCCEVQSAKCTQQHTANRSTTSAHLLLGQRWTTQRTGGLTGRDCRGGLREIGQHSGSSSVRCLCHADARCARGAACVGILSTAFGGVRTGCAQGRRACGTAPRQIAQSVLEAPETGLTLAPLRSRNAITIHNEAVRRPAQVVYACAL
jgi:hypothetical protein